MNELLAISSKLVLIELINIEFFAKESNVLFGNFIATSEKIKNDVMIRNFWNLLIKCAKCNNPEELIEMGASSLLAVGTSQLLNVNGNPIAACVTSLTGLGLSLATFGKTMSAFNNSDVFAQKDKMIIAEPELYDIELIFNGYTRDDIDTSEITTFESLFWNSKYDNDISKLKYIDVSDWDVSNVNNFRNTFYDCEELVSVGDLSDWDMTNAENISGMFYFCKSLTNIGDLSNWNITNKLTNTSTMFCMCKSIKDIGNIGKWDMSNVKSTVQMFMACSNLKNVGDLSNWDFTNVLAMSNMFWSCSSLKSIGNISKWKEPKAYKSDTTLYWHEIFTGSAIDAIPDWYMFN